MRRRRFLGLIGGAATWPVAARGEQTAKPARVGFLITAPIASPEFQAVVDPFRKSLQEIGYVEGRNLITEYRSADGYQERFPRLAMELVRLNVDVIVAASTPHARAAMQATRTIPIVVPVMGDPIADGFVDSLARPGRNLTGLTSLGPELTSKRLELLKSALPRLARLAVLWQPDAFSASTTRQMLDATSATARQLGVDVHLVPVPGAEHLESAFSAAIADKAEAVYVFQSSMLFTERRRIIALLEKHRLPAMCPASEYARLGALMAYGANVADLFRRSAVFVDKILKGGSPADLPVEQPTTFELVVNLNTASALGIKIPYELLTRADEVIE